MARAKKKGEVKVRLLRNYFMSETEKITPAETENDGLMLDVDEANRLCDAGIAEPFSRFGEAEEEEEGDGGEGEGGDGGDGGEGGEPKG